MVDVDSFIGEVHGYEKQGASFGYTKRRGYHPLMASRAQTGEVLHVRLRKGKANSSRGVLRFAEELIARVARAGSSGEKLLRADSAFWNNTLMKRLEHAGWRYSISIRSQKGVVERIAGIPESAWTTLTDYPTGGEAQIAETTLAGKRMIVRRTRLIGAQARTFRRRLLQIPGRLTYTARRWTLHLPARWPWQGDFTRALARIRALPTAV